MQQRCSEMFYFYVHEVQSAKEKLRGTAKVVRLVDMLAGLCYEFARSVCPPRQVVSDVGEAVCTSNMCTWHVC